MPVEQAKLQNAIQFISQNIADKKNIEYEAKDGEINLEVFEGMSSDEIKEEVDKLSTNEEFKDIFDSKEESDFLIDALYSMIDANKDNSLSESEIKVLANNYNEENNQKQSSNNNTTMSLSAFISFVLQTIQNVLALLSQTSPGTSSSVPVRYKAPSFGYSYTAPSYGYFPDNVESGSTKSASQTNPAQGSYANNAYSSYNTSDGNIKTLLDVASGEVGQREATGNNDGAAVKKYGRGQSGYAWCANFVSWCLEEGLGKNNPMRRSSYCPDIVNQAKSQGAWAQQGSGYAPQAGDVILFDWDKNGHANHVGIVEKVENGTVYTIEGNSSNSVKRNTYSIDSKDILGYYQTSKAMKN